MVGQQGIAAWHMQVVMPFFYGDIASLSLESIFLLKRHYSDIFRIHLNQMGEFRMVQHNNNLLSL